MDALSARPGGTIDFEAEGQLYPRSALAELSTALACFTAAFHGRQDCVWLAEAGLRTTCVDIDEERLEEMRPLYPSDWAFVCSDVFEYAQRRYAEARTYDLVNLDPPTNLFERCAEELDLWCSLATCAVVLGIGRGTTLEVPAGWHVADVLRRSHYQGGTYWALLEPRA